MSTWLIWRLQTVIKQENKKRYEAQKRCPIIFVAVLLCVSNAVRISYMCTNKVGQILKGEFTLAVGGSAVAKTSWKDLTASQSTGSCKVQTGLKRIDSLVSEINQGGDDVSNDRRIVANRLKLGVKSLDIAEGRVFVGVPINRLHRRMLRQSREHT